MDRVIGHVDGFSGGVLNGWVANIDDPRRLEHVCIYDQAGRCWQFSAHFHRPDVCKANGMEGIFGFSIKREWLDDLSETITLLNRHGEVLVGGVDAPLPKRSIDAPEESRPLDIFLHIPKSAGTSVRNVIRASIGDAETLLIYPSATIAISEREIRDIPLHQRQRMRLAIGHCNYGVHERLEVASRYSAFLREPTTRLRSNFAHHGAARTVFSRDGESVPLARMVNEGLSEEFDNHMVRILAGLSREMRPSGSITSDDVGLALRNIRERFKFIGLYETLNESFAEYCEMLAINRRVLPADNVTPATWPDADEQNAALDWDAVLDRNRHDAALYNAVIQENLLGTLS